MAKPNSLGRRGPYPDDKCEECGEETQYYEDLHNWDYFCANADCPKSPRHKPEASGGEV